MKVGLIGTGRMASNRARNLLDAGGHELTWICSRDRDRARSFMKDLSDSPGRTETVETLEDGLERLPVDAVIDTSPNALHRQNAERIFDAECHLFVEYPHACTVEDGRWVIEKAARVGKTLHVGLTHRFGAGNEFLSRLFRGEGKDLVGVDLGRAYSYSEVMCSGNPISRWFDDDALSGGMFVASMYHYIDQVMSFFGDPTSLRGTYASTRDEDRRIRRDSGHALLAFGGVGGVVAAGPQIGAGASSGSVTAAEGAAAAVPAEAPVIVNIAYSRGFEKPGLGSHRLVVFEGGYLEQSRDRSVVTSPSGEVSVEVPSDDSMYKDTMHFFGTIGSTNQTAEWAQSALQIACSLQEDAGVAAGRA